MTATVDIRAWQRELAARVAGPVLVPGDDAFAHEVAGFNTAAVPAPQLVVGVTSTADIVEAVRFAKAHELALHVQGAGHGGIATIEGGLLISTRRLDHVRIAGTIATVGAGVRWDAVIAAAAERGLAPIAGSSVTVGVVGYLLGGGLGPLVRSHGFSSDRLVGATVVTGGGDVVEASAHEHADLLWALRGGKVGLGVVAELRIELVELRTLYAGSLTFDEPHIEAALRAWVDYTATADPRVSTSVAIVRFPPLDRIPDALRGRRVLALRFAYPGASADGERLAAPLRAAAPVYIDALGEMPAAEVARIHNDPPGPVPSWVTGALLARVDQAFATALLAQVGPGTDAPFVAVDVRQLGAAAARDVPGGSAVGGRGAGFTLGIVGTPRPELFATVVPAAAAELRARLAPWTSPENNVNFLGEPADPERLDSAWPPAIRARLAEVRRRYG